MIKEVKKTFQFMIELFDINNFHISEVSPLKRENGKWEPIVIEILDVEDSAQKVFSLIDMFAENPVTGETCKVTTVDNTGVNNLEEYKIFIQDMTIEFSKFSRSEQDKINRTIKLTILPYKIQFKDVRSIL